MDTKATGAAEATAAARARDIRNDEAGGFAGRRANRIAGFLEPALEQVADQVVALVDGDKALSIHVFPRAADGPYNDPSTPRM